MKTTNAVALLLLSAATAWAAPTSEYASSVLGFSSQWSSTSWSAAQALGAPDTFGYGDISTAWAPAPMNGTAEYLTLGFATPTYAHGFTIRETYGNGFVYRVDALDQALNLHPIWTGTDPSQPGTPVDFTVNFPRTSFLVAGLKIYINTNHNPAAWEEIDSVRLDGETVVSRASSVPEGGVGVMLMGAVLAGLACRRRRG